MYRAFRVYRVDRVDRGDRVYRVYRVYRAYRVYRVYRVYTAACPTLQDPFGRPRSHSARSSLLLGFIQNTEGIYRVYIGLIGWIGFLGFIGFIGPSAALERKSGCAIFQDCIKSLCKKSPEDALRKGMGGWGGGGSFVAMVL